MLKQGNCIKRFTAVSTDSLQADPGESFLIRRIYAQPETGNTYLTLKTDRKTVGVYRIQGRAGNHLDFIHSDFIYANLMEFLERKEITCSLPIAEGQSFTVSAAGTSPTVTIVYDIYDAGDIRADMSNGTEANEYMFMQYMDTATVMDQDIDAVLDVSLSPAEFPDFPCGKSVPANCVIDMLGLAGLPAGQGISESDVVGTSYVKMIRERETLFDEDRNGLPFFYQQGVFGGTNYHSKFSLIGDCIGIDVSTIGGSIGEPLIFEPALHFLSGEELNMFVTIDQIGSRTLTANSLDIAAIMKVTKT